MQLEHPAFLDRLAFEAAQPEILPRYTSSQSMEMIHLCQQLKIQNLVQIFAEEITQHQHSDINLTIEAMLAIASDESKMIRHIERLHPEHRRAITDATLKLLSKRGYQRLLSVLQKMQSRSWMTVAMRTLGIVWFTLNRTLRTLGDAAEWLPLDIPDQYLHRCMADCYSWHWTGEMNSGWRLFEYGIYLSYLS